MKTSIAKTDKPKISLPPEEQKITMDLNICSDRDILLHTSELIRLAQNIQNSERASILDIVHEILSQLLPICKLDLPTISEILGLDFEINKRRRFTQLNIKTALEKKFPDVLPGVHNSANVETKIIPETFVPPASDEIFIIPGTAEEFSVRPVLPRKQLILELLAEMNIDTTSCVCLCGVNAPNMFRKLSYQMIIIPSLNKMVLFCDEAENRTYIIYTAENPEKFFRMTKNDLRDSPTVDFLYWNSDISVWKNALETMLWNPQIQKKIANSDKDPSGAFVQPETSASTCTLSGFCKKKGINIPSFRRLLEYYNIKPCHRARVFRGKTEVDFYSEQDLDYVFPKKLENGDILVAGVAYTAASNFADEKKLCKTKLKSYIDSANLKSHPILGKGYITKEHTHRYYLRSELESAIPTRLDENDGFISIGDRVAVVLRRVESSPSYPFNLKVLKRMLAESGAEPAQLFVRSPKGSTPELIYWKDDVDSAMPYFLNPDGTAVVNGVEYVGINAYAHNTGKMSKLFRNPEGRIMLKPVTLDKPVYFGSTRQKNVYKKEDVDAILNS